MKSQSALEFMTIIAIGLMLISISSFFGYDYIFSYFDNVNTINTRQTLSTIISAVNLVYSQGIGAQTRAVVMIPSKTDPSYTYISGKEINFRLSGRVRDIHGSTATNILGSLPKGEGETTLYFKMTPEGAIIFLDSPVSYVILKTFNDSARTNPDTSFNVSDIVYYSAEFKNFSDSNIDADLVVNIYYPNSTLYLNESGTSSNGVYQGSFVVSEKGPWLISLVVPEVNIFSTKLIFVS